MLSVYFGIMVKAVNPKGSQVEPDCALSLNRSPERLPGKGPALRVAATFRGWWLVGKMRTGETQTTGWDSEVPECSQEKECAVL